MWKLCCVVAMLASLAGGETVHLTDGTRVRGKLYKSGVDWTLVLPDGTSRTLGAAEIVSIDFADHTETNLSDQLSSLRHSLEFTDKPLEAIARLWIFIEHNPGTAAAREAGQDLSVWQDRNNRHLVKVGDDWITSEEARHVREHTVLVADEARRLIRAGDIGGATRMVNQIVALDPHSVPGLYLQGVLAYNPKQLALSEKDFLAVAKMEPAHGPTLNNLAIFSFHQQHFAQAALRYDQALAAAPFNRTMVDNVAEFFHDLPPGLNVPEVRALQKRFENQQAALVKMLGKEHLIRFGARWVSAAQNAQIEAAEKIIAVKTAELEADRKQLQDQIASWDQQIARDVSDQGVLATPVSAGYSQSGAIYSQTYYDLQREIVDLKARRLTAVGKLEDAEIKMRKLQSMLPVQPFTGVQEIIGEEGTPIAVDEPTTRPTKQGQGPSREGTRGGGTTRAAAVKESG